MCLPPSSPMPFHAKDKNSNRVFSFRPRDTCAHHSEPMAFQDTLRTRNEMSAPKASPMHRPLASVNLFLDKFKLSSPHVLLRRAANNAVAHASSTPHAEKFKTLIFFTASAHVGAIALETLFSLKFSARRTFARAAAAHNAETPSSSI